ncbi:hypothetical protein [Okeania sp. SIO1I7]|uniref:hypothetical protein n=1 Tax=Okeania sp. SIO1I7 TaxID=2607772 RepID=UPI0025CDD9E1|nr:hypothetical protein [Okeania sp. SIO1I7]
MTPLSLSYFINSSDGDTTVHGRKKHTVNKYWGIDKGQGWVFITPDGKQLRRHKDTPIKRVVRLKGEKLPYDGDWTYWTQRLSNYTTVKREVTMLMKKQKGKCPSVNNTLPVKIT